MPTTPVSSIHIRAARREDIPALVRCATTSTKPGETAGFGGPPETRTFGDPERLATAWKEPNHVGRDEVLVAVVEGQVVGYVTVEERDETLELDNIDVEAAFQRRGIGTRLVEIVEERARAAHRTAVTLGTSRNAEGIAWRSLPWWQARGYRVTGEEQNVWTRSIGEKVREIRMRKDLR
jgi:ribosomal protein S18 acetylase RimI-like enzyme